MQQEVLLTGSVIHSFHTVGGGAASDATERSRSRRTCSLNAGSGGVSVLAR